MSSETGTQNRSTKETKKWLKPSILLGVLAIIFGAWALRQRAVRNSLRNNLGASLPEFLVGSDAADLEATGGILMAKASPECEGHIAALEKRALEATGLLEKQDLLATLPKLFRQHDGVLEIGPETKPVYKLEDKKGETYETFIQYEPWAYLPDLGYAIIHYNLYEGDGYTMLNMKGGELHLASLPFFSSSRKYFAVINPADEAAYNWSGVQIYSFEGGDFVKVFEASRDNKDSLIFLAWENEAKVNVIETLHLEGASSITGYKNSSLVLKDNQWQLESGGWIPGCDPTIVLPTPEPTPES